MARDSICTARIDGRLGVIRILALRPPQSHDRQPKRTTVAVASDVVKFERVLETLHVLGRCCAAHPEADESCGRIEQCKNEGYAQRETDGRCGGHGGLRGLLRCVPSATAYFRHTP